MKLDVVIVRDKEGKSLTYPVVAPAGDPDELLRQFYAIRSKDTNPKDFCALVSICTFDADLTQLVPGSGPYPIWYSRFGDYRDYTGSYNERFQDALNRFPAEEDVDCDEVNE